MVGFGEAVLDVVRLADHVEAHLARPGSVAIARLVSEPDAVVGESCVNAIRHGFQQVFEELPRRPPVRLIDQLGDRQIAGAVDTDEQVKLALTFSRLRPGGLHLGDVHVEEAERVTLEARAFGPVFFDVRKTGDAVALQTAVQR
jgi:hypothetical protein